MRTVTVPLTRAEHRLLSDLAAAEGVGVEALVREALALAPLKPDAAEPRLRLVHRRRGEDSAGPAQEQAAPGA